MQMETAESSRANRTLEEQWLKPRAEDAETATDETDAAAESERSYGRRRDRRSGSIRLASSFTAAVD